MRKYVTTKNRRTITGKNLTFKSNYEKDRSRPIGENFSVPS